MTDLTGRTEGFRSTLGQKAPCYLATTASITLSGFKAVDGTTPTSTYENLRILVGEQASASANGIYVMQSGIWERAKDFDGNGDFVKGTQVRVQSGATRAGVWVVTSSDPHTIDSSTIEFSAESSLLGAGIEFVIDGGGGAISTGQKGYIELPFSGTITQSALLADQVGSIVLDVWLDSYSNYPPTVADTITASAKPTLSSAIKSIDTTLTGWGSTLTQGYILGWNVDSTDGIITRLTHSLRVSRIQ